MGRGASAQLHQVNVQGDPCVGKKWIVTIALLSAIVPTTNQSPGNHYHPNDMCIYIDIYVYIYLHNW